MHDTCTHCGTNDLNGFATVADDRGTTWSCEPCTAERASTCAACDELIWPEQAKRSLVIVREGVSGSLWEVHAGCAPSHVLRCAWEVWDERGGPEEGGWTFKAGVLVAAVPVPVVEHSPRALLLRDEALAPVDALLARAFDFDGRRRVLSLTLELTMPASSFPESRPHYE